MICPNCQNPVSEQASTCPACSTDLVDLTIGAAGPTISDTSRRPWLVFAGSVALVMTVGLGAWAVLRPDAAGARLAGRFPADTVAFVEFDFSQMASEDTRTIVEAFAPAVESETGEPFSFDGIIDEALASIDERLGGLGLSFEEDIASWASGRAAVGVFEAPESIPSVMAAVVTGDDAESLDAFLAKLEPLSDGTVEVAGVTFHRVGEGDDSGLIGRHGTDLVVASTEQAAAMVVPGEAGDSLADVPDLAAQLRELPNDPVMIFAVDGARLGETAGALGLTQTGIGWTIGAVTTEERGVRLDYVGAVDAAMVPSFSDRTTEALPDETLAFFRIGWFIDQATAALAESDLDGQVDVFEDEIGVSFDEIAAVFSEDGAMAVWPSSEPELPVNAAIVGVSDTTQAGLVEQLAEFVGSMGLMPIEVEGGYNFGGVVTLGVRDTLTLLTTDRELLAGDPDESFADGELARRAGELVSGELIFAVDVPAVIDLVDGFVAADDPQAAETLGCLPLGVAAGAITTSGTTVRTTTFLEVAPRC